MTKSPRRFCSYCGRNRATTVVDDTVLMVWHSDEGSPCEGSFTAGSAEEDSGDRPVQVWNDW